MTLEALQYVALTVQELCENNNSCLYCPFRVGKSSGTECTFKSNIYIKELPLNFEPFDNLTE